jgi:2-dehydro-3-deoxyphosphogluconate aldolase/(4S)-4-hydroxy-2-oxoglutarate aldolase
LSKPSAADQLAAHRVVPVVAVENTADALPLADALLAGGLPLIEVTFRTAAAAEVIARIVAERPQMTVGAGTVLTADQAQAARDAGASFAVAPGVNPAVIAAAQQIGLPFFPGVATPTDIETAVSLGCCTLKFFPAETFGGVNAIRSIAAPYRHLGIKFVPTGGVNTTNVSEYLACRDVLAVGGTWLAKSADIAEGNFAEIEARCRAAVAVAKAAASG